MKLIIDDRIPYIRQAVSLITTDVRYLPGAAIGPEDVRDADALIVRTRTRCDRALLEGSRVSFVATATIGTDHLDIPYLDSHHIAWTNCPGCNAASVCQWVECTLLRWQEHTGRPLRGQTIGIVGRGHVGSLVEKMARGYGLRVLVADEPLAASGAGGEFCDLADITREADIITFHVPLTRPNQSPWPTWHMASDDFFNSLQRQPLILNSARGPVIDTDAIVRAIDCRRISGAAIDTWEGEPEIDFRLLKRAFVATPHIAGYSADGKVRADNMALNALCRHFRLPAPQPITPPPPPQGCYGPDPLQRYDPLRDTLHLRLRPDAFEQLRGNYPVRRE